MNWKCLLTGILVLWATASTATQFQSGDWSAAKIGNRCFVYTERAAPNTSGTLIFSFENRGYNASFTYEYTPWSDDEGVPWDPDDLVLLGVDGAPIWLGEEMMTGFGVGGYAASMTAGFVPDMVLNLLSASETLTFALERQSLGETWAYGIFSTYGFRESLTQASQWCDFDTRNLPQS